MKSRFALLIALLLGTVAAPAAEPAKPAPLPKPAFIRTLYVVRHGAYDASNAQSALVPLGIAQARLVAARLRGLPVEFTSLTASTMTRAQQTARVIHESLPQLELQSSDLLRECTPRTWRADVMKKETPADLDAAEAQLTAAYAKFFVPAVDRDRFDILVCHGNVTRWFVCKALGVDPQAWLGFSIAHCSVTIIQVKPDGTCRVLGVGDAGHIPPNLQSGMIAGVDPQLTAPVAP